MSTWTARPILSPEDIAYRKAHVVHRDRITRPAHRLKENKSGEMPTHMHFVDVETCARSIGQNMQQQDLVYGVSCYWERAHGNNKERKVWSTFSAIGEFWTSLLSRIHAKEKHYLIAHNLKADARCLEFERVLLGEGWAPDPPWDKGTVRIYRWHKDKSTLTVMDNLNLCVGTIEGIGEDMGIAKVPIDFESKDYKTMCARLLTGEDPQAPDHAELYERLKQRCHNDVLVMVTWWGRWLTFLLDEDWGNFGITVTKQAWNMYLHKYYEGNIFCHNNAPATALERDAYRGGRADVQHIGAYAEGTYYDLDGNAHYGSQMIKYMYPSKLVGHAYTTTVKELRHLLHYFCLIARVTLTVDVPIFPHKVGGFTSYPTGTFTTTLTTRELEWLFKRGQIHQVHEVAWYEKSRLFAKAIREVRKRELEA
ncbi:DNA polymerase, partial [Patescibacteria group bacterium]|nr:DNA polymerase [Patescibacteria group bacterium]